MKRPTFPLVLLLVFLASLTLTAVVLRLALGVWLFSWN